MKKIAFLTVSTLFMIFVSLACATNNANKVAVSSSKAIPATTSNPASQKTIADTILNPDFQAFLKNSHKGG